MSAAFRRAFFRLMTGGALLYSGLSALIMGLLIIWANLLGGEASLSGPLAYLSGFQAVALPLYAMDAFARDRRLGIEPPPDALGTALGYVAGFVFSCLAIAGMAALVLPQPDTFAALAGYALGGCAMLCACLVCAARTGGRVAAFFTGLSLLVLWQAAPQVAGLLDGSPLGAKIGRAILYLSPASRCTAFLNGSLDLSAAAFCLSIVLLALYLLWNRGVRFALKGAGLWALCAILLAVQPASLTQIDLTQARVTTVSDAMETSLGALNLPVTVYQIAPVGAEDPWVALYLKKLAERHTLLTARTISPSEDSELAALDLPENSLVIEQDRQWVILRYDNLYQSYGVLTGQGGVTFELEGALLTALDEATGLVMAGEGAPAGRYLSQTLTMEEERRSTLTIWLVVGPMLICLAGAALTLIKKRYER